MGDINSKAHLITVTSERDFFEKAIPALFTYLKDKTYDAFEVLKEPHLDLIDRRIAKKARMAEILHGKNDSIRDDIECLESLKSQIEECPSDEYAKILKKEVMNFDVNGLSQKVQRMHAIMASHSHQVEHAIELPVKQISNRTEQEGSGGVMPKFCEYRKYILPAVMIAILLVMVLSYLRSYDVTDTLAKKASTSCPKKYHMIKTAKDIDYFMNTVNPACFREYCENQIQTSPDLCYQELAISHKNLNRKEAGRKACKMIIDETKKTSCIDIVCEIPRSAYGIRAGPKYESIKECTQITPTKIFQSVNGRDVDTGRSEQSLDAINCYTDVAVLKKDPRICANIELEGESVQRCYILVAKENNDASICENIVLKESTSAYVSNGGGEIRHNVMHGRKNKAICLAVVDQDITQCDTLGEKTSFDVTYCVIEVASITKNADICKNIPTVYERDECFKRIITITQNSSLCHILSTKAERDRIFACMDEDAKEKLMESKCI